MKKTVLSFGLGFARVALAIAVVAAGSLAIQAAALAQDEAGPCAEYAQKLCEKADPASCKAITTTTGLMPADACKEGLKDLNFSFSRLEELKKKCADLGDRLCADIGEDTETCKMVRSKLPQMGPDQCQGMITQYPKVLADLQRQEAANKPLSAEDQKAIAAATDAAFGAASAKVTVVEFSDFQCPYCTRAAAVANEIKKQYPEGVRFVFRQFPLSFHKDAHLAAQASLAAGAEGKFWEYHDVLFQNQKALGRDQLEKYAADVGLDVAAFKKALDDGTYKAAVDADIELGKKVAVSGTPTMFVNGERVSNPTDIATVSAQIDKALKTAQ